MNDILKHVEHLRKFIPEAERKMAIHGDYWMGSFRCGGGNLDGRWTSEWIADLKHTLAMEEAKLIIQ